MSKILVSRGNLQSASNARAVIENGNVTVSWSDNSGMGLAKQTDKALIAVLNPEKGEAITIDSGAERMEESQTVALPSDWSSEEILQVYLGFVSEDGREVANSVYLGAISL